jgi:Putative lumazine-binding
MRTLLTLILLLLSSSFLKAQTTEDSIKTTINTMFAAMKGSNADLLTSTFGDSAMLQTITKNKEGKTVVRNETVASFAKQVAAMPKDSADERITYNTIKIDGALANVWTPYEFYYNQKFSHCGVNNFVLVRIDGAWKIQYIIDTRRKQGCK